MEKTITEGIPTKKILTIAIPLILQQLSLQLQLWVDRAMLGHVDTRYFSAVGNAIVPYHAITAIILAVCTGTTILIAQSIGSGNRQDCQNYAECSYVGNAIFPVIAFLFFFFGSEYVFKLIGVQSPILEYSASYMRILCFSLLILGPVTTSFSILQGIGITKVIMLSGIVSNILNILLDWVLIFGNWGFPQMNIEGAAYASTISNFLSAPIAIIYVLSHKNIPFSISIQKIFCFHWSLYKNVLKVGIPSGLEFFLWNIGNIFVVSFLNKLDILATGIYTLLFSIQIVPLFIYMGFANAALTLVGHKTGADDQKQAIGVGFKCLRISLVICAVIAALYFAFPKLILRIFTNDMSLINYAASFLLIIPFIMFPQAVNNVIGRGIRGMGDTRWMLYSQIFGTCLVITLSYLLIFTAGLGLLGIFVTLLVDETVRGIINLLRFWKGREVFFLKPFGKIVDKKNFKN
jgi:putative MATE family efflux protein